MPTYYYHYESAYFLLFSIYFLIFAYDNVDISSMYVLPLIMEGKIRKAVNEEYFTRYPSHKLFINAFINHFNINWANTFFSHNTELSVFLLEPLAKTKEAYGFDREIILAYSNYDQMQPRAIQAIEEFMDQDPAKGRADPIVVFLVSKDADIERWIRGYTSDYPESRIFIPFYINDVIDNSSDYWHIRNIISDNLYSRDLFDYKLPLEHDLFYFGRSSLLSVFLETVDKRENLGLFGLRKTGKTSFLYKLRRQYAMKNDVEILFYDCKSPTIRMKTWFELLEHIGKDLLKRKNIIKDYEWGEKDATESFGEIIDYYKKESINILLIFDEIEYISPMAIEDTHWHKGYIPFWQSIWTIQSSKRNLSFIVAGVNSEVIEKSEYDKIQNPLFGIVKHKYLTGLSNDEIIAMLEKIGRRMGIRFDHDAKQYICERYGGHPYITRLACSMINTRISSKNETRPVHISRKRLVHEEEDREEDLAHYSRHVISELEKFYPDEYTMLEMLALGQQGEFMEYDIPEYTMHIKKYGLITYKDGKPVFSIPAIKKYIANEASVRQNVKNPLLTVSKIDKKYWVSKRIRYIIKDINHLDKILAEKEMNEIYGINSIPNSDKLISIKPCKTEDDFTSFIALMYKVFVESIKNIGGKEKYDEILAKYPNLGDSLERIRLFRNNYLHQRLSPYNAKAYEEMMARDFDSKIPREEEFFIYQYKILDELFIAIQIEIQKIES